MIDAKIYKFFADIVYKKTGIFYPEKDFYRLDSRLNTLMSNFECQDPEQLYNLYLQNMTPAMETLLIDLCTNNETYFFRDNKPFDALSKNIVPEIISEIPNAQINIWSCACSTGQEPLSILMSLKENCRSLNLNQIELTATDISTKALSKCRSGVYSNLEVQRGLPITLLMKYFDNQDDGNWQIKPDVSSRIKYGHFNLLTDEYAFNKYDVIFCRNVLIYQDKQNKEKIINNLFQALKPGGYLLMGAGESMIGSEVEFEQASHSNMMVFKKPHYNKEVA